MQFRKKKIIYLLDQDKSSIEKVVFRANLFR